MVQALYLIRHAEPVVEDGQKGSLSAKGRNQAQQLAQRLSVELSEHPDVAIHHSPVARCQETAKVLGQHFGLQIIKAPLRLKGADNLILKEAQSKFSQYIDSYEKYGIESPLDFANRVMSYIQEQSATSLLLVGNEVPLQLLLRHITGANHTTSIGHASCIKIWLADNGLPVVQHIN